MTEKRVSEISPEYLVAVSKSGVPVGYKQTEIGVIPDDWKIATIGDTCELLTGFPFPSSSYADSGVRLLRGSNVKRGCTDWSDDITQYWPEVTSTVKQYELMAGDIVISMDGSLVGRSFAQLNEADLPALLLQRVARVRSSSVSQNYLKEWICSKFFTEHCDSVKTVTAIPHISPQDIRTFKFLLPISNEEQTAIANALSDVDALIQELEKLIAKKQAIKTATMQQLLTGRTRLPQFAHHPDGRKKGYKPSELGEIPEDWEVCEFGNLLQEFRNGYAFSADGYEQTGIPIITMAQIGLSGCFQFDVAKVNKWDMNQLDKLKEFWVQNGDLLIAMTDVTPDKNLIGQMTIAKLDCVAFLNQRVGLLRMRTGVADATFFSFLSCLPVWKQYCRGVASLGVQANIGTTDIRKAKVYCPPIGEQAAITRILSDIDSEIQAQQHRLDKTRQIKQGMMQELLTGKTRLKS